MAEHKYNGRSSGRRPNGRQSRRPQDRGRYSKNKRFDKQKPKAKPSLWQRIISFFGLLKGKKSSTAAPTTGKTPKVNTRVVKSTEKTSASAKRAPKLPKDSSRLYIGNLSYEATESDIEDLFKGIGDVRSVEIIYNPHTHKSKGYGFVEMRMLDDATRAVEVLHDQPFMGRNLTVGAANERVETMRGEEGDSSSSDSAGKDPGDSEMRTPVRETVVPLFGESKE